MRILFLALLLLLGSSAQARFQDYAGKVANVERANLKRFYYNNDSGSTAEDHSPSLRSSTVNGATMRSISQPNGYGAPDFDGVNDNIDISTNLSTDVADIADGTVIVWMKVPNWLTHGATQVIFGMQTGAGDLVEVIMSSANDKLASAWQGSGYRKCEVSGMNALVGNNWFVYAMTWDNATSTITCRINGGTKTSTVDAGVGTVNGAASTGGMGARNSGGSFPFDGNIGFVAVWDKVLTDAQVIYLSTMP